MDIESTKLRLLQIILDSENPEFIQNVADFVEKEKLDTRNESASPEEEEHEPGMEESFNPSRDPKLTDELIMEIADFLDCGMTCYFHRPTGTIEYHPDPDSPYYDPEPWQDILDKIDEDWENYDQFEKMNSTEGFKVMEDFAYSLKDTQFRNRVLERLARRKPFQNFKHLVESSNYRQDWFDFKREAYIDFVKDQIR